MDAGGAADVILEESDRMTELVEELLDISKIDMGRQRLALSETDIRELLYDSIRAVEPAAAAGGIAIVPDFPEEPWAPCPPGMGTILSPASATLP